MKDSAEHGQMEPEIWQKSMSWEQRALAELERWAIISISSMPPSRRA